MKRFNMIDEGFTCLVCKRRVEPLNYTARDHCPFCLCSVHVDNNPGDRSNDCKGILRAIDIEKSKKDTFKIIYKCDKCGVIKKNKMALDDDYDMILKVMSNK